MNLNVVELVKKDALINEEEIVSTDEKSSPLKIKRTRKSKKQLLDEEQPISGEQNVISEEQPVISEEQPVISEEQSVISEEQPVKKEKKVKEQKIKEEKVKEQKVKKTRTIKEELSVTENTIIEEDETTTHDKIHKKRGRKPKGGKIIVNSVQPEKVFIQTQNVILHLKCGTADQIQPEFLSSIIYNPSINQVETFQFGHEMGYSVISSSIDNGIDNELNNIEEMNNELHNIEMHNNSINNNELHNIEMHNNEIHNNEMQNGELHENTILKNDNKNTDSLNANTFKEMHNYSSLYQQQTQNQNTISSTPVKTVQAAVQRNNENEMKTISAKLKELTTNLHLNNISYKKSACFWCTHDFDNPPIYIPKHEINEIYYCYGCFCSPECATAFLFKEHIDTATRFERYHLLNHIYCKIYDYNKNVKPAPDPYYLLNKYYGNLTIQEYRQLLKNERLLIVVDKPLSRTLPELHEDNDDFMFNGKTIPSGTNKYKLKKKNKPAMKNNTLF